MGERKRKQGFEGNDIQRNRETRQGGGGMEEWTGSGRPNGSDAGIHGGHGGRQAGELGDRGYEREFYGANEGRGAGAGSRRYPEIRQGYMGGEYAGGEYGAPREERDYRGAPMREPEFGAQGEHGFQRQGFGAQESQRWEGQRHEAGRFGGRRDAPESESWGGRYASQPDYRSRMGQPGAWSPASPERGSAWSGEQSTEVRFGMHAPWELRPRDPQHYEGGWAEGGSRDSAAGRSGGRASQYGRGPKGYTRSDERLHEEINECLMRDHDVDASNIEVKVERGIVTLGGSVSDRQDKYRVEDLVCRIMGVKDVTNQLRVGEDRSNGASSSDGDKGETVKTR